MKEHATPLVARELPVGVQEGLDDIMQLSCHKHHILSLFNRGSFPPPFHLYPPSLVPDVQYPDLYFHRVHASFLENLVVEAILSHIHARGSGFQYCHRICLACYHSAQGIAESLPHSRNAPQITRKSVELYAPFCWVLLRFRRYVGPFLACRIGGRPRRGKFSAFPLSVQAV